MLVPEEEVVADGLKLLVNLERDHNHDVADDGGEGEDASGDGDHHYLTNGVVTLPFGQGRQRRLVEHRIHVTPSS